MQHVSGCKRRSNHPLDLMISRENSSVIKNINVFPAWISDHCSIQASINTAKVKSTFETEIAAKLALYNSTGNLITG